MEKKTFVIPVGLVGLYAMLLVISGRIVQLLSLNSSNSKTFASVIINFVICALFLWLNKKYIGVKIDFKFTFSFFKRHIILATVLAIITILIVNTPKPRLAQRTSILGWRIVQIAITLLPTSALPAITWVTQRPGNDRAAMLCRLCFIDIV